MPVPVPRLDPTFADRLTAQPWMTASQTRAVLDALEAGGGPDCARFVGGCVRNALLDRAVDDIDIATTLTPDEATASLQAAGLRVAPTGVEHGTVTAIADHRPFEVTTLRRDVSTDGRRAVVAFTTDWAEDAQRRDFRLNAIYCDRNGGLFDPTGKGVEDAQAGRIVFVGDPMVRIREDYLRILRFFRFHAWFGRGEPDAAAVAACRALKGMLAGRAAERTQKELLKLLAAEDPRGAVQLMRSTGVLEAILPMVQSLARFDGLVRIQRTALHENDAELRLAAMIPPDGATAELTAERLRLSNAQRDRLVTAMRSEPRITSWMSPREVRRALYRLGRQAFTDRVRLAWAEADTPRTEPQWLALLAAAADWSRPELPITGADVKAAGAPVGPLVGQVLREVEDWWVDEDFPSDPALAQQRLAAVIDGLV